MKKLSFITNNCFEKNHSATLIMMIVQVRAGTAALRLPSRGAEPPPQMEGEKLKERSFGLSIIIPNSCKSSLAWLAGL
jgi:hypothetical protein